jgi:SAM-dependent methyltransferase
VGRGISPSRLPQFLEPGGHTAYGSAVDYRLDKVSAHGVITGDWLDCGCAEGYYAVALTERGARSVIGVDVIDERVAAAQELPHPANVTFQVAGAGSLPFDDESFDGVLVNEVLEHVEDEQRSLLDIKRVLRPGGHLVVFSPNRWFPFEGHGARMPSGRQLLGVPVPLMPWLPARLTRRFATARNYWPGELRAVVAGAGLEIVSVEYSLAQFDRYLWMPRAMIDSYRRNIPRIEASPLRRFVAVSTFVLARRPA